MLLKFGTSQLSRTILWVSEEHGLMSSSWSVGDACFSTNMSQVTSVYSFYSYFFSLFVHSYLIRLLLGWSVVIWVHSPLRRMRSKSLDTIKETRCGPTWTRSGSCSWTVYIDIEVSNKSDSEILSHPARMLSKLMALEVERTLVSFVVTVGMEERSFDQVLGTRCLLPRSFFTSPSMHINEPETNMWGLFF